MSTQVITAPTGDTPQAYKVTGTGAATPQVISAHWDGNGAAGEFMPCVSFYSNDGKLMGRFGTENTVAAGDSARVTYGPFLRNIAGFIRYDVLNKGDWLDVQTTGTGGPFNVGVHFDVQTGEFRVDVDDAATGTFRVTAPFIFFDANGGIYRFYDSSLEDHQSDGVNFTVGTDGMAISVQNPGQFTVDGQVTLRLAAGQTVDVMDHLNSPIFRVDEDGDLHGKTGKTLTFDL